MATTSDSTSSSSGTDDRNPSPNPDSIDLSLDAIENQLASISMSASHPQDTTSAEDDEVEPEYEEHDQLEVTANGSLNEEENRAEVAVAVDSIEKDELQDESSSSDSNPPESSSFTWRNASKEAVDSIKKDELQQIESSSSNQRESASFTWRNASEEADEAERPLSPSSSGYAGERGSSISGGDEINDDDDYNHNGEIKDANADGATGPWVSGKRHAEEDDASVSWRKRKKHFIILSNSGKPIYSRYGDEHKLAGFSATLQAIISFVENGGDRVNLVRAGKHQVVFLVKGPIYLVCISCTEESYDSLRGQLELLYGQMILILTKSVNRCFEKNPKYDMSSLLGGTDAVFSSLIHSFSWNPATFLHAYSCLPLACATRQAAGAILHDISSSGVVFALLMCRDKVISLVGAQKASLHPDDIMLLSNFIMSSESFRTSESFSPICLPRYSPMAFLYGYVHYFDADTYLVLLTTSSDSFYDLKDSRIRIETVLLKSNVLSEVQRSLSDGGIRIENMPNDLSSRGGTMSSHLGLPKPATGSPASTRDAGAGIGGPAGLWHFIYRSVYLDQYVASEFSPPINSLRQKKRLYRAFQRLHTTMHDKEMGPHKTQFRRDENYVLLSWVTQDFELYAAFDPLADKALAIKTCNRVCQWVKNLENDIFLQGASPFSW